MKLLTTIISFLCVLSIVSCSQLAVKQRIGDSNAIPYPLETWKGVQGKTLADSKPDFIGQPKAPDGAPNVLIVMLDDGGYSSATSYGGVMRHPRSTVWAMKAFDTRTCPWPRFVPRPAARC
jgi:hypothetical protein